jgi:hypothetical protein
MTTPGIERLILADCARIEATHRPDAYGHCLMCGAVWRRPIAWPCEAVRITGRLRELCDRPAIVRPARHAATPPLPHRYPLTP